MLPWLKQHRDVIGTLISGGITKGSVIYLSLVQMEIVEIGPPHAPIFLLNPSQNHGRGTPFH